MRAAHMRECTPPVAQYTRTLPACRIAGDFPMDEIPRIFVAGRC